MNKEVTGDWVSTSIVLEHKGYVATVKRFTKDGSLQAKAINVDSMLAVGGSDLPELAVNYVAMTDDYLNVCAEFDEEPEKPRQSVVVRRKTALSTLEEIDLKSA